MVVRYFKFTIKTSTLYKKNISFKETILESTLAWSCREPLVSIRAGWSHFGAIPMTQGHDGPR